MARGSSRGMIASRERSSPPTPPPLRRSPCRKARTVPTTVPSIFTTPSAVMSPTTRIPVPMMESPASPSDAPCPFSVNIAMSVLLFHDRQGIERFPRATDFKVEVRRRGPSRVAGEGDHLPRLHRVAVVHQDARGVPVHRLIAAAMLQEDELAVGGVGARHFHDRPARGPPRGPGGHPHLHPPARFRGDPAPDPRPPHPNTASAP